MWMQVTAAASVSVGTPLICRPSSRRTLHRQMIRPPPLLSHRKLTTVATVAYLRLGLSRRGVLRARWRGNPLDAMETCLSLDSTNRELQLAFKKTLRHSSGLQFKVDGVLNTVTTDSRATAKLSKVVLLPLAPAGESGKRRTGLRISLGARVSTTDKRPMITMDAKQKVTLLSSSVEVRNRSVTRSLTQAVARSTYDMDPQTHKGFGVASVALQHTMFEALPDQDIRVSLGATFPLQNTMVGPAEPFLKIQENCWGLMLTRRQGWKVTYDL